MVSEDKVYTVVLGVDGGGTKTSAWLAVASKPARSLHAAPNHANFSPPALVEVIGKGEGGPGNPRSVGFDIAVSHVMNAIQKALEQANSRFHQVAACENKAWPSGLATPLSLQCIGASCIGLAGAGRTEEQSRLQSLFHLNGLPADTIVIDDIEPLRWATRSAEETPSTTSHRLTTSDASHAVSNLKSTQAVTLIAGTGSICRSYNSAGETYRSGGWGYLLGDEGSGFHIGLGALQQLCKNVDRGRELSILESEILDSLHFETPQQLIGWIYQSPVPRREIANLASIVMRYRSIDPMAREIADKTIEAWHDLISTAARRAGFQRNFHLSIAGGVPNHCLDMVEELVRRLRATGDEPLTYSTIQFPVLGTLWIAIERWASL